MGLSFSRAMRELKKLRRAAHLKKLAEAKSPMAGVKPPDPVAQQPVAPGSGVDGW